MCFCSKKKSHQSNILYLSLWLWFFNFIQIQVHGEDSMYYRKIHKYEDDKNRTYCTVWSPEKVYKTSKSDSSTSGDYFHMQKFPAIFHSPYDRPHKDGDRDGDERRSNSTTASLVQLRPQLIEFFLKGSFGLSSKFKKELEKNCDHVEYQNTSNETVKPQTRLLLPLLNILTPATWLHVNISNLFTSDHIQLVQGGHPKNRIDIVFMGDGYTKSERHKFFSDVARLVNKTFFCEPFAEFLPLLNIYARFTPSTQSGIGYNGITRNTFYKLYRPPGSGLRGIYVKNINTARKICLQNGALACDFPVIIANDDYYGGIGGEFAISTSSLRSGTIVLRHELGHVFARVGEEYDHGEVYVGSNSSPSLSSLKWSHWIDYGAHNVTNGTRSIVREERTRIQISTYPKQNLEQRNLSFTFNSDGTYGGWYMVATLSGAMKNDMVTFLLDGLPLEYPSSGSDDKEIYTWKNTTHGLSKGQHILQVYDTEHGRNRTKHAKSPPLQIGSLNFYEIGGNDKDEERGYHMDDDFISAYPTWDYTKKKSYRPTANSCLMRNMTHHSLCSICKESIWLQFLRKVSLIDDLDYEGVKTITNNSSLKSGVKVTLRVLQLGQFRSSQHLEIPGEKLEIRWRKNNIPIPEYDDKLVIFASIGDWEVSVQLLSPRVRNDPNGYLHDKKPFSITEKHYTR